MCNTDGILNSREYGTIKEHYGERAARRSKVPLINHINEGVMILAVLNAPMVAWKAFCIHPIVQNGLDSEIDVSWSPGYKLAREYTRKANAYLCIPQNDYILDIPEIEQVVGYMSGECRMMLMADKFQNQKDFALHHRGTHPRSAQLEQYFELWINYLRYLGCLEHYDTYNR